VLRVNLVKELRIILKNKNNQLKLFLLNLATSGKYKSRGSFFASDYLIRYVLMNFLIVVGNIVLVAFGNISLQNHFYDAVGIYGLMIIITTIIFILARTKLPQYALSLVLMVSFAIFCFSLIWFAETSQHGGFLFIFLLPSTAIMLLGMRSGVTLSVILGVFILGASFFAYNIGTAPFLQVNPNYSFGYIMRIWATYFMVLAIMIVIEFTRTIKDRLIQKQNKNLREGRELAAAMARERETAKMLHILFDTSPLLIEMYDENLNLIDFNQRNLELFGISTKEEMIRRNHEFRLEYQPNGERSGEIIRKHATTTFREGSCRFEWLHRLPNGEPLPLEVFWTRGERDGKPIIVGYCHDLRPIHAAVAKKREAEEKHVQNTLDMQDAMLKTMAELLHRRDDITGGHITRTERGVKLLLEEIERSDVYREERGIWDAKLLLQSCQLHDVGKISISDNVLKKPGKLTAEEFAAMKEHALVGQEIIEQVESLTKKSEFLHYAKIFAGTHHERWNGTGYPKGLKGEDIPLLGRIMAIADVYDALTSERPYKKAFPHEEAIKIISEGSGTDFDPTLVDIFLKVAKQLSKSE